jgi:hypothetical protein
MIESTTQRYRGFISYSQHDKQHARRLHSALEAYRVPKGIDAPLQPNRRLGRFFRDDDEMGASTDLGGTLRDALENSENLIVICSPHAARSKWVNAEILHFKNTGRGDRIFAVVVDGTPNSDDPESNCFPPALRFEIAGEELLAERPAEPLGIDLRKERFARCRIRLVAGLMKISFDSLWQRERRRLVKRRAIAGSVTLLLGIVIAVLSAQWLTERGRGRIQKIDRALVGVRDDLASERAKEALVELDRLYAQEPRGVVRDALTASLSWVSSPTELLADVEAPALVTNGAQLFFVTSNGGRHLLNLREPYRRILSSDRRWLLILGAEESLALDVADGREVARAKWSSIQWTGHALETNGGLLVVGGRDREGGNFRAADALLVFSPHRQTLSVFDVQDHWNNDWINPRSIDPLAVNANCSSFGMSKMKEMTLSPAGVFTFSPDTNGLKPTPAPSSFSGWRQVAMFDGENECDVTLFSPGAGDFEGVGCIAPAADSASPTAQSGATRPVRPIGLGTFWEPERRWKLVGMNDEAPRLEGEGRSDTGAKSPSCSEEHPCPVQDSKFDGLFPGLNYGRPGWTTLTPPRGVHEDDRSFDYINGELVYAGQDIANAGFTSVWCRNLNSKLTCLEMRTGGEIQNGTGMELRSTTGRLIFYPRGGVSGFHLYDLLTMRDVTPPGPELVASTHWADFSPDDKRLFLTMNGRLLVFALPSDGGPWQPSTDGSVHLPARSRNIDDEIAGLFALDNDSLAIVRSSGVISRFDWRTGQESWQRTIGNVGQINRAVVSRNRRFLLLIGKQGGRLLDTKDGLVLSGALVPPSAMDGTTEMLPCFDGAFVSDTGAIDLSCGKKKYRREQIAFGGDVRSRLREILSDQLLIGSN